jgi:asparagine synthase (glutamine-hydrolysing)
MLAGAWGTQAGELLERAYDQRGAPVQHLGRLTTLADPDLVVGRWACWLFGEPEDRGALKARFGLKIGAPVTAAFGRALAELGDGAYELVQGRFAVVAHDRERDVCVVIRDQLGAQPIIYTRVPGGVLFGEHERDLIDLLPHGPHPDRMALMQWVDSGVTLPGRTLYDGLQRLPAGHRLILDGTHVSVERWWSPRYEEVQQGSVTALGGYLRDETFAAVARAAANSLRPAVKLSGGLDSASVAAGLSANGFADGRGLAIGGAFAEYPTSDESELIAATAHHTQLPLELVAFDSASSMLGAAVEHIANWRLPPATPNLFLWQPVIARARELGVDLMLDGEGGDELFGLAPYLIGDRLRAGRLLAAWSLTGRIPGIGQPPDRHVRVRVLRHYGVVPLVPHAVQRRRERARIASASSILRHADALALFDLQTESQEGQRDGPMWWRFQAESLIDERDAIDMAGHFRREAVDARIEMRHPLLQDLQLIEAALRLPPQAQFDPVRDRPLLRDGLRGLIPESVRTRHEKSYFTPLVLAGLGADESRLIEPLRRPNAPLRGYVAPERLDRMLAVAADDRSVVNAGPLWRVAIANRWLVSLASEGS